MEEMPNTTYVILIQCMPDLHLQLREDTDLFKKDLFLFFKLPHFNKFHN